MQTIGTCDFLAVALAHAAPAEIVLQVFGGHLLKAATPPLEVTKRGVFIDIAELGRLAHACTSAPMVCR